MSSTSDELQSLELLPSDLLRPLAPLKSSSASSTSTSYQQCLAAQITGHTTLQRWRDSLDIVQQRQRLAAPHEHQPRANPRACSRVWKKKLRKACRDLAQFPQLAIQTRFQSDPPHENAIYLLEDRPSRCGSPEPFSLCDSERIRAPAFNRMDDLTSHFEAVHRALCRYWNGATVITSTETIVALI
jgi:hypothetical protein